MPTDTFTQVAPNSSGNKIRNLSLDVLQADGTISNVQMQVVIIADEYGHPLDVVDAEWKANMLDRLDDIVNLLKAMADFRVKPPKNHPKNNLKE